MQWWLNGVQCSSSLSLYFLQRKYIKKNCGACSFYGYFIMFVRFLSAGDQKFDWRQKQRNKKKHYEKQHSSLPGKLTLTSEIQVKSLWFVIRIFILFYSIVIKVWKTKEGKKKDWGWKMELNRENIFSRKCSFHFLSTSNEIRHRCNFFLLFSWTVTQENKY